LYGSDVASGGCRPRDASRCRSDEGDGLSTLSRGWHAPEAFAPRWVRLGTYVPSDLESPGIPCKGEGR